MLGMEKQCILIEDIESTDNYNKLKDYFSKFGKIKNIRIKLNSKTGKN
jgi:RNA recognition motif-containing protein